MNTREKIVMYRTVFVTLMVVALTVLVLFNTIYNKGSNFEAGMQRPNAEPELSPEAPVASITEPQDSHQLIRLTFGGTCTPASLLGSSVYGTFNSMKNEVGTAYFFSRLSDIFTADDLTLVGCNSVISDANELSLSDDSGEWYLTTSDSIEIFTSAGVDALSLACPRNMDYGWVGYAALKSTVKETELMWGDASNAIYKSFGDIDVGIYCCILSESDRDAIIGWIRSAAERNDFVVLYVCDTEGDSAFPSESKTNLLHAYVDAGADLIVATNGKELQHSEKYGDGYIIYSLGALLDGTTKYPERLTALLQVSLKANDGEIFEVSYDFIPVATYDDDHSWQPYVLEDGADKKSVLAFFTN